MFRNIITKSLPIQQTAARRNYASTPFLKDFITSEEKGPVETSIEAKLIEEFDPSTLHIVNESHMHSHHSAMKGNTNKETHFRYSLMQRHRSVYKLLQQEIDEGVHALTLRTKTQAEIEKKV
ncbi:bola protein [Zychaea mexicana]|uniref:bola protein n=1 Tax=Zychaea mexicana TaxID=64656 RepID=UPI0022FDF81F|nr:bola protein [Zychaea mexicana]KAI9489447.1 bola protein [Zychaea mexicana]